MNEPAPAAARACAPLSGSRALITGAGRGIGRAIALALAAEGVAVTAIARTATDLTELCGLADEGCQKIRACAGDVRDGEFIEACVEDADADLLVTAAGINRPGPITALPESDLRDILEVNVFGTLLACRCFGGHAIAAGRPGAVVTLSSQMGVVGYPGRVPYCASKHAVNGLTKALALEWAPHRIRVNAVAPTFIRTPLTAPMFADPAFEREVLERIPLGRIGEVREVTGAIRFLLSEDAALITGHILAIDGGWTVQ